MKTRNFILLGVILLFSLRNYTLAQSTGIYLTHKDFDNEIISFVKKENLKYKFRVDHIFDDSYVKIVIDDSCFIFKKDSIFGYRDYHSVNYRFYNKKTYRIINPREEILLYSITSIVNPKGNQTVVNYFFSINTDSPVYPLTKPNLKKAFYNDLNFHDLIDVYFRKDSDLLSYDVLNNQYTINSIYNLTKSEK